MNKKKVGKAIKPQNIFKTYILGKIAVAKTEKGITKIDSTNSFIFVPI